MPPRNRFDPELSRHEDLLEAIERASHHIATAITQGFKLMADAQTTALADLNTAVAGIADAIAGCIGALQTAVTQATQNAANIQPDDSAAIEAEVTKLNDLTTALKTAVAPPVASPPAPMPATSPSITTGGTK